MDIQKPLTLILDILLVVAAVATYWARPRIGGELSKGLRTLLIGVMILGLAHLVETALFWFAVPTQANEVIHRLFVMAGFAFVIWGFVTMRRAFGQ